MLTNHLKRLIDKANKSSNKTRWGCYPLAPSIGLSEKEISLHQKAAQDHAVAYQALVEADLLPEAETHQKAMDNHNLVVQRVGNY